MTKQGYGSIGTLRQCRLHDIPFTGVKDFEKMPCGKTEVLIEGEKLLVRWKDNSVVTTATNAVERYSQCQASRWSEEKKKLLSKCHNFCVSLHITKTWVVWICMTFMCQDIDLQQGQRSGGGQSWPGPFTV